MNYTSSYGSEWSTPDTMKRYSMYLTPKGKGKPAAEGPWVHGVILSQVPPGWADLV
jgi:hypothetical protein